MKLHLSHENARNEDSRCREGNFSPWTEKILRRFLIINSNEGENGRGKREVERESIWRREKEGRYRRRHGAESYVQFVWRALRWAAPKLWAQPATTIRYGIVLLACYIARDAETPTHLLRKFIPTAQPRLRYTSSDTGDHLVPWRQSLSPKAHPTPPECYHDCCDMFSRNVPIRYFQISIYRPIDIYDILYRYFKFQYLSVSIRKPKYQLIRYESKHNLAVFHYIYGGIYKHILISRQPQILFLEF